MNPELFRIGYYINTRKFKTTIMKTIIIAITLILLCVAIIGYLEEALDISDDLTGDDKSGYN